MRIDELIGDTESVILAALTHPGLAPKRKPTIELAMKAVAGEVEKRALVNVQHTIEPILSGMYQRYVLINGEYEDVTAEESEDYTTGLDDELEKALEPFTQWLSANWLGIYTIGYARFWESDDAIPKFARVVAKEVFKQLSYDKTPSQILSNAGIVQSDVEIYLTQHLGGTLSSEAKQEQATVAETNIENIIVKMRSHLGDAYDPQAVRGDIELACDDDDILAGGAATRLGLDGEDVPFLQTLAVTQADHIEYVMNAFKTMDLGGIEATPPPPPPPSSGAALPAFLDRSAPTQEAFNQHNAPPPPPTQTSAIPPPPPPTQTSAIPPPPVPPRRARRSSGGEPVEGAVPKRVLELVKNHSARKDVDIAAAIGVSRATYNNYVLGKTGFNPAPEEAQTYRALMVQDINGLLEALALFDKTERTVVA